MTSRSIRTISASMCLDVGLYVFQRTGRGVSVEVPVEVDLVAYNSRPLPSLASRLDSSIQSVRDVGPDFSFEEGVHVLSQRHPLRIPQFRIWFGFTVPGPADGRRLIAFRKSVEDCFSGRRRAASARPSSRQHQGCPRKPSYRSLWFLGRPCIKSRMRLLESKALGFLLCRRITTLP